VGWAYDAPKQQGSAKVVAPPKARAMPVMVEEEADSEVAAVTSRMATATLPPSAALAHAASRQQAAAPPLAPAPAVNAAKAAVSYSFLVPPAPATAGDAPGASEASKLATQLARAEANESLYGDRACQALPTRAVRRGCLNPIVDCVAPGQVRPFDPRPKTQRQRALSVAAARAHTHAARRPAPRSSGFAFRAPARCGYLA
jgi:hypothetical protein